MVDPVGTSWVSYFSPRGRTVASIAGWGSPTIQGGAGNRTAYDYDGQDRVTKVTRPEGDSTITTYNTWSNPLTVSLHPKPGDDPPAPLTTTFTYVAPVAGRPNFQRVASATDPRGTTSASYYDRRGNLTGATADTGGLKLTSRFTHDDLGRVLTATDPAGAVTLNVYETGGNRALLRTISGYGPGCASTGHLCLTTSLGYDAAGNVTSVTDPNGNVTRSAYDANRREVSNSLPSAPAWVRCNLTGSDSRAYR